MSPSNITSNTASKSNQRQQGARTARRTIQLICHIIPGSVQGLCLFARIMSMQNSGTYHITLRAWKHRGCKQTITNLSLSHWDVYHIITSTSGTRTSEDVFYLLAIRCPARGEGKPGIEPGSSDPKSSPLPLRHHGGPQSTSSLEERWITCVLIYMKRSAQYCRKLNLELFLENFKKAFCWTYCK